MNSHLFNEGITKTEFDTIVDLVCRRVKRLSTYYVKDSIVKGCVLAQSGISEWWFELDFNDNGHLTGSYSIVSGNDDSSIPEGIGAQIQRIICDFPNSTDDAFWEEVMEREGYSLNGNPSERAQLKKEYMEHRAKLAEKMHETRIQNEKIEAVERIQREEINAKERIAKEAEETERAKIAVAERKRKDSQMWIAFLIMALIPLVCFLYSNYLDKNAPPKVTVSYSAKDFIGMDYGDVKSILRKDGFTDISLKKEEDVVLGVIVKDGEVKKVTINGSSRFKSGDTFDADAKVVIIYHTRK